MVTDFYGGGFWNFGWYPVEPILVGFRADLTWGIPHLSHMTFV